MVDLYVQDIPFLFLYRMNCKKSPLPLCVLLLLAFCFSGNDAIALTKASFAEKLFRTGNFARLSSLNDSLKNIQGTPKALVNKISSLNETASRILLDFNVSEQDVDKELKSRIGSYTQADKQRWEDKGWLEYKIIDGKKRYFNRAAENLQLRMEQYNDSVNHTLSPLSALSLFDLQHTEKVISQTVVPGGLSIPVNYTITYKITVKPDVVPAGEIIRCWLPYPKENHARQSNVRLLETSQSDYIIAPDSVGQRSIYMEKKANGGQPTEFQIKFSYSASAQYFDLSRVNILPCNKKSSLYKKYTAQQGPHIIFTSQIKTLADKIAGKEKDPVKVVRKLYNWINQNIIWSGALEYSTMENIPQYVLDHRRGDCGMQTLLFMTMARYRGIPVRWESGWMLHPVHVNLHDWSEVYFEGVGWVPIDMSFGLQRSEDASVRDFYISGLDSYRLIVNDEISTPFVPRKNFERSEPIDFQRGEVEWRGGNLYFDKWDYSMKREILN